MNRRKLWLVLCLLFSMTVLFTCLRAEEKKSTVVRQATHKNGNETRYKMTNAAHHQENLSQTFPNAIVYKGNSRLKWVALTFDDGPDHYYTPRILDILQAKGVHATFFIVGKEAQRFPDMVRRMEREGHVIGNHTWDHPKLWKLTNKQVTQEISSTQNEIQRITGHRSSLFRPPYGGVTPEEVAFIHNQGYGIIDWSVDTLDWKGTAAPKILKIVKKEVSPGSIILEHSLGGRPGELNGTLQALPQIIDHLRAQGYQFVTVPTLLSQ